MATFLAVEFKNGSFRICSGVEDFDTMWKLIDADMETGRNPLVDKGAVETIRRATRDEVMSQVDPFDDLLVDDLTVHFDVVEAFE